MAECPKWTRYIVNLISLVWFIYNCLQYTTAPLLIALKGEKTIVNKHAFRAPQRVKEHKNIPSINITSFADFWDF